MKSPPRTHGPLSFEMAWAATCRIIKFSSVIPSVCLSQRLPQWRPPFTTALTWANAILYLKPSGMPSSSCPFIPWSHLAVTAMPPLALSAAVSCAAEGCSFHFIFLAVLTMVFIAFPALVFVSCSRQMSAVVFFSHVLADFQELALQVSIAHKPLLRHSSSSARPFARSMTVAASQSELFLSSESALHTSSMP